MVLIAVIPARGGSKSMPRKSLIDLHGHPLIAYSIDAAIKTDCINRVIVSTDDFEIAECARSYNAEVIVRPSQFSQDNSRDDALLRHVLEVSPEIKRTDYLAFLRPTHPIRSPSTILQAFEKYISLQSDFTSLRSMKKSSEIVFKTWGIASDGSAIKAFNPELTDVSDPSNAPRQELPHTYYQDGYIEVLPFSTVVDFGNTSGPLVLPFIIDEYSHDIDYLDDLRQISDYLSSEDLPAWFSYPARR